MQRAAWLYQLPEHTELGILYILDFVLIQTLWNLSIKQLIILSTLRRMPSGEKPIQSICSMVRSLAPASRAEAV